MALQRFLLDELWPAFNGQHTVEKRKPEETRQFSKSSSESCATQHGPLCPGVGLFATVYYVLPCDLLLPSKQEAELGGLLWPQRAVTNASLTAHPTPLLLYTSPGQECSSCENQSWRNVRYVCGSKSETKRQAIVVFLELPEPMES